MGNFRPDKKLKRKKAWKRWRKTRNILENWVKEESNRVKLGLPPRKPPVRFSKRRKYPIKELPKASKKPKSMLKWYQKLGVWLLYYLHKWLKKKKK